MKNIVSNIRAFLTGAAALTAVAAVADATVKINEVKVADPWTTVDVAYTLGDIDADIDYKVVFDVTAKGVSRSVTNEAAKLVSGPATKLIDMTALFTPTKADPKAQVAVRLVAVKPPPELGSVQLWAGGPYFAERNVGATKPEEYGYYFWWGDTEGYRRNAADNGWVSVKDGTTKIEFWYWDPTAGSTYGKDIATLLSEGWIDASGNLTLEHDAARAYLGGGWRMPTSDEIQALVDNTTRELVDDYNGTGVSGYVVTGKGEYSGNSIFLPAAGRGWGSFLGSDGEDGDYWSSTPWSDKSDSAAIIYYNWRFFGRDYNPRENGLPVRPVRD